MVIDQNDLEQFTGRLKRILTSELRAGNHIAETWHGDWPSPGAIAVVLSRPFLTPVKMNLPGIVFNHVNDPHYWKADYHDTKRNLYLICGFSGPPDLIYFCAGQKVHSNSKNFLIFGLHF